MQGDVADGKDGWKRTGKKSTWKGEGKEKKRKQAKEKEPTYSLLRVKYLSTLVVMHRWKVSTVNAAAVRGNC